MDKNNLHIGTRKIIQEKLREYLIEFDIQTIDEITDNDETSPKELLLLAITRDFINFEIDFDLFASLLGRIWIIDKHKFHPNRQSKIEQLCYIGSELQWYIRNNPKKRIDWLQNILEFYKENKAKLPK